MIRSTRRRAAGVAILTGACLAGGFTAGPAQAAKTSFSGSCQLKGTIGFSPGLTGSTRQEDGKIDASGPCSGGAGRLVADFSGPVGCTGSTKPATGTGTLTVAGREVPVKVIFDIRLPVGKLSLGGTDSGAASGNANFVDSSNLMAMSRCPGAGIKTAKFTTSFKTTSSLVSGSDDPVKTTAKKKRRHRRRHHHHHHASSR